MKVWNRENCGFSVVRKICPSPPWALCERRWQEKWKCQIRSTPGIGTAACRRRLIFTIAGDFSTACAKLVLRWDSWKKFCAVADRRCGVASDGRKNCIWYADGGSVNGSRRGENVSEKKISVCDWMLADCVTCFSICHEWVDCGSAPSGARVWRWQFAVEASNPWGKCLVIG